MQELILASGSQWRAKMLRDAGVRVRCIESLVDESVVQAMDPVVLATTLARAKADVVHQANSSSWVLGADQVVFFEGEVFGKPTDPADHLRRLRSMRGCTHQLVTAFVLLGPNGQVSEGHERTDLTVRADLSDAELRAYVQTGEGSGCAGGYAVEGHGAWLFESINGDWNNVIGLPLFRVLTVLRQYGWVYRGDDAP